MTTAAQYSPSVAHLTVSIANGASESDAVFIHGTTLIGIVMPGSFDGTSLTLHGSLDGVTFQPLYKDGIDMAITVAAGKHVVIQPADLISSEWIKPVASSTQSAQRQLTLALRAL